MTAGGIVQIVSRGLQDQVLTSNPEITYFKISHRRHTLFAMESIELTFNNILCFDKSAQCEIQRLGDLASHCILKVVLPEVKYSGDMSKLNHVTFAWVKNIGHAIIQEVQFQVGGLPIDKHYGEWLQIWQELTGKVGHDHGVDKLLGNVPELTSVSTLSAHNEQNHVLKDSYPLFIPLQFSFNRHNGLAIPLVALQNHSSRINVRLRPAHECYIATDAFKQSASAPLKIQEASLFVNYIFLSNDERKRYARSQHDYLIEQIQASVNDSIGTGKSTKLKIDFNHPIKALYWVTKLGNYRGGKFMVYEPTDWEKARENAAKLLLLAQFDLNEHGYFNDVGGDGRTYEAGGEKAIPYQSISPHDDSEEGNYTFDSKHAEAHFANGGRIGRLSYSTPLLRRGNEELRHKVDGVIRICADLDGDRFFYPEVQKVTRNDLSMMDLSTPVNKFKVDNRSDYIRLFDVTVWQHDNYGVLIDGTINPMTSVELGLNNHSRQSPRHGNWYNYVVPLQHFGRTPKDGINVFSFAIDPQSFQPGGSCNFSRMDGVHLNLSFDHTTNEAVNDIFSNTSNCVSVYGQGQNVFRVISGLGGLSFAN